MNVVYFETEEERARGLRGRIIDRDTVYIFPKVKEGTIFSSDKVVEPFEIAFIGRDLKTIKKRLLRPPADTSTAPTGTALVLEAVPGLLEKCGF